MCQESASRYAWWQRGPQVTVRWFLLFLVPVTLTIAACGTNAARPGAATSTPAITSTPSPSSPDEQAVALARRFDGQQALEIVTTLADPAFMGRHVGTAGELAGAEFLANAFAEAGLEPGGDDHSFLQSFSVQVQELAELPMLELTGPGAETRMLRFRGDFRPVFGGAAGGGDITGQGLFVGSGEELSELDVTGKVLVVAAADLRDFVGRARDAGALAVIGTTGQATLLKSEGRQPDPGAIPVARVSQSGAVALLEGSGHTRQELNDKIRAEQPLPSFPLAWTVHLSVSLRPPAEVEAHNVIGVLPGTSEGKPAIVVGAHFEEIGPDPDGVVYPAANDNASGTAVLVQLARLFRETAFRPVAPIVFIAWSGHEEGLVGSRFYVNDRQSSETTTRFYLNLDTVGQGADPLLEVHAAGGTASALVKEVSDLFRSQGSPLPIRIEEGPGGATDDRAFIEAGVPAISLVWGDVLEDGRIHTPADTADTVDASKLEVTGQFAAGILLLAARRN